MATDMICVAQVLEDMDTQKISGYLEHLGIDISIPLQIDNYENLADTYFTKADFVE